MTKIRGFLEYLWKATDGRILNGTLLLLAASLTEGLSLILLIPILAVAGPDGLVGLGSIPVIGSWFANSTPSLTFLLVCLVILVTLQSLFLRYKLIYNARIFQIATDRTRLALFRTLGMARWECFSTSRMSDLNNVLTGEVDRILGAANSLQVLVQALFLIVIYAALALLISWQMTLFALIAGTLLFAVLYPVRQHSANYGDELTGLFETRAATILEFLSGMREAKSYTAEEAYAERFRQHLTENRVKALKYARLSSNGTLLFQVGSAVIGVVFVWLAISVLKLDLARIAFLIVIFLRLVPRFLLLQQYVQQFLTNLPAYENFRSTIDRFAKQAEPPTKVGANAPRLASEITVTGLSKSHVGNAETTLSIERLAIRAGAITALIGPSGSGKSTLADMLMGLTTPSSGTIHIDGVPLTDENRRLWRKSVAFVQQDPFLFHDSIAVNLRLAKADASEAEIWDALDSANIAALVRSLPDGIETIVGDRGMRFSGGERQRLVLARALIREPQLLILDEATSALDWENEAIIAATIEKLRGSMTIITIAHRSSMIQLADDVVALASGKVVEAGRYDWLSSDPESYVASITGQRSSTK